VRLDRLLHQAALEGIDPGRGAAAAGPGWLEALSAVEVSSVHCRAQNVRSGGLFVAVAGFSADGHDFAEEAVHRGASALVVEKPVSAMKVPVIQVADSRLALAKISTAFYGRPAERLTVVGITGTNGKTTTAWLVEGILQQAGFAAGVIGTINWRYGGKIFDNPVTTPESIDLQRMLAEMVEEGVTHVAMEVSSHGLSLNRIEGCSLDVGVFTNLSQDHLDFHRTMESYWQSKRTMFVRHLGPGNPKARKVAVINIDDPRGAELAAERTGPTITTSLSASGTVRAEDVSLRRRGIRAELIAPGGAHRIESALVGRHNLENILSAAGVGIALGIPVRTICEGIGSVKKVPGRLEPVKGSKQRFVFVDYAHTPDALDHALVALRAVCGGRLICLFGCGGDRDRGKRPQMGELAAKRSDLAIVTSDNPRTEDPHRIIEEIVAGIAPLGLYRYEPQELAAGFDKTGYAVEADRRRAIALAASCTGTGDTVLIAGKGHETYQIIGGRKIDFDDRKEAQQAFSQ
jgi:UDP-N-acetylmuramoyl-L-alanyl-D-glutamate--2,6-diaminopimelate ligase/murE/murF fusion protein